MHEASPHTRIGIALVEHASQFLVGVRDATLPLGGMHEFPGGKCHPQESPAACAVRECLEETGLRVEVVELLEQTTQMYDHATVELFFYVCRLLHESPPQPSGGFEWIPFEQLAALNFPKGNRIAVQKLMQRAKH